MNPQPRCVNLLAKEHLFKILAPNGRVNKRKPETEPGEDGAGDPPSPKPKPASKAKAASKGAAKKPKTAKPTK